MKIVVGCDHAGFPLKSRMIQEIEAKGHTIIDVGAADDRPSDYPDFARKVGDTLKAGKADRGLLLCGSGVGVSIAASKIPGIRAALCHDTFSARQGVEDDDMNVLCIGCRVIGPELASEVLLAFLAAQFSNAERHARRVAKVQSIERDYCTKPVTVTEG